MGLVYTVIPLYRLSVTDNELARKTIELAAANASLAKWYEEVRHRAAFSVLATELQTARA